MSLALALAVLAFASPQSQTPAPDQSNPPSPPPASPSNTAVGGVLVDGNQTQSDTSIDRRSYSMANDLQAATGSIADVLRNIPAVQVDLQGNVSLRGDANVTVLVDGKPSSQFSGDTLAQALQSLPASQLDHIEVMTNPSAEFRADGSGGVINLVMKKAKGAGKTGAFRIQAGTGPGGLIGGNLGYNSDRFSTVADFSFQSEVQIPVIDNLQSLPNATIHVFDDNEDLSRSRLTQYVVNGHLGTDYDVSDRTRLSGALRFTYIHADQPSTDNFEQNDDFGAPSAAFSRMTAQQAAQSNEEVTTSLRHTWTPDRDLVLTGTYAGMQYERSRFDLLTPTLPAGPVEATSFGRHTHNRRATVLADYETPLPGGAKLKLGYDFDYSDTVFEHAGASGFPGGALAPVSSATGSFRDQETRNQAYVTYERRFGKLDAQTGLRGEVLDLSLDDGVQTAPSAPTYGQLDPSLHLSYDLAKGRKLTASYSRRVDRPPYALLDPVPYNQNPGNVFEGNEDLRPQATDSLEFGYETRKDKASFLASLYYRQTHDAFSYLYTPLDDGGLLQQAINAGSRTNGGLELVIANKLTDRITYSLSADAYWSRLAAPSSGPVQTQSTVSGFGRANLSWQLTPKDFLQINLFVNGKGLLPQGYVEPLASGNIGYRHTLNNKVSWMFVIQDPFKSAKSVQVLNAPGGGDRQSSTYNSRMASLTLVWNFSGKPQQTNFDFKAGGYEGQASGP